MASQSKIEELQKKADADDVEALCDLGKYYMMGVPPVQLNTEKATELLEKAAKLGSTEAKYCLGLLYGRNFSGKENHYKALDWFLQAAEEGHHIAMGFVGTYYLSGPEIPQDIEKGLYWMEKSADNGDAFTMLQLSDIYNPGNTNPKYKTIEKDIKKRQYWLEKAARAGNREALEQVGISKLFGQHFPLDVKEGLEFLERASDDHSIVAQSMIGFCYESGVGLEQSYEKALEWYLRAVRENGFHPNDSLQRIKMTVFNPKTKEKSVTYIEHENAGFAWYRLGVFYEEGLFVIQNKDAAINCYKKACALGEQNSCAKLGQGKKRKKR